MNAWRVPRDGNASETVTFGPFLLVCSTHTEAYEQSAPV